MFQQLEHAARNSWWNKLEADVTPKSLLWVCICFLMLGMMIGFNIANFALKHRWDWSDLLQFLNWSLLAFIAVRPVYKVIKRHRESRNG